MEEIWKDIEGYEGLYQISSYGRVKSLNYRNKGTEGILTPKCNCDGRLWVDLWGHGKPKHMLIHRLVGMAFIPNPNNYPQINHMDENPKNNRAENLEWCTGSYNIRYSLERHPRQWYPYPTNCGRKVIRTRRIVQLDLSGNVVRVWDNLITIKHETGWNEWHIEECCKGNRHKAKGYIWRYAS